MNIEDSIRNLLTNLNVPSEGSPAPAIEMFPQEEPEKVYKVQKIITEVYVYTDLDNMQYGAKTFQDVILMGEMTKEQIDAIVETKRQRKRRK